MSIALIGGMDRLSPHYAAEARKRNVELRIFPKASVGLSSKVGHLDAIILFTDKMSHRVRREVVQAARTKEIPVLFSHSCGVCSLRQCLEELCRGREAGSHA